MIAVIQEAYVRGISTRSVDELVKSGTRPSWQPDAKQQRSDRVRLLHHALGRYLSRRLLKLTFSDQQSFWQCERQAAKAHAGRCVALHPRRFARRLNPQSRGEDLNCNSQNPGRAVPGIRRR